MPPVISTRPYVSLTDEELQTKLKEATDRGEERGMLLAEIKLRRMEENIQKLSKPHWTLTPGFWIIFVTMVLAAIAAWPVIQGWFQHSPPANTSSSSLQPQ